MFRWVPFPFVRVCLVFIAGIITAIYSHKVEIEVAQYAALTAIFLYAILLIFRKYFPTGLIGLLIGLAGLVVIFAVGYAYLGQRSEINQPGNLSHFDGEIIGYKGVAMENSLAKTKSYKTLIELHGLKSEEGWKQITGNLILYQKKDSSTQLLTYGDEIVVKGVPELFEDPANPHEFNYKRFLSFENVYHRDFVNSEDILVVANHPPNQVLAFALKIRGWAQDHFRANIENQEVLGIVQALVLGIRDELDADIRRAYGSAGAMHVLAVSGLHVGILYLALVTIFSKWKKRKYGRWIFLLAVLSVIWLYAFVTGLSASVLRASVMFSVITIAEAIERKGNIYNTLAVAAFILLIYDPFLIMSVGFQLSFMAVLGIVYVQPRIYRLLTVESDLLDKLWQITSVSLAAQLATFPLSVLYFHQFPVYFVASNLLVIPAVPFILGLGFLSLFTAFIPIVSSVVSFVLEQLVLLMNYVVVFIESLPFSIVSGIHHNVGHTWLLYGTIIALILLFGQRKFKFAVLACCCFLGFTFLKNYHFHKESDKQQVIIYDVPGNQAINFIDGNKSFLIADSLLQGNTDKLEFHIRPKHLYAGIPWVWTGKEAKRQTLKIPKRDFGHFEVFVFKGHRIGILDKPLSRRLKVQERLKVDQLIVSNNAAYSLASLNDIFEFKKLILDSSCRGYRMIKLIKGAKAAEIDYHSVIESGALIINFDQ